MALAFTLACKELLKYPLTWLGEFTIILYRGRHVPPNELCGQPRQHGDWDPSQRDQQGVHLVQIWAYPWKDFLTPKYFTRHFTKEEKQDKRALLVVPATVLSPNSTVSRDMPSSGEHRVYMQVVQTSGLNQGPAQGAHVRVVHAAPKVELRMTKLGNSVAEALLFDVDLE